MGIPHTYSGQADSARTIGINRLFVCRAELATARNQKEDKLRALKAGALERHWGGAGGKMYGRLCR